eukprot:2735224-Rhodomonas_salina.1
MSVALFGSTAGHIVATSAFNHWPSTPRSTHAKASKTIRDEKWYVRNKKKSEQYMKWFLQAFCRVLNL